MATGNVLVNLFANRDLKVELKDNAYGNVTKTIVLKKGKNSQLIVPAKQSGGWYDFTITIQGNATFAHQYAGRVETGKNSISDPLMGQV